MKKNFISIILCLLLFTVLFSTVACASTNIDLIKPDEPDTIIIIPGTDGNLHIPINQNPIPTPTPTPAAKEEETSTPVTDPDETAVVDFVLDDDMAFDIYELTNQERVNAGLNKLEYSDNLQTAADIRAVEIASKFSHTRPDGTDCNTAITDEKEEYRVTGENIIQADNPIATARVLMNSWMDSQGHKDNILLKDYTEMAVGVYVSNGVTYAVQVFAGK